MTKLSAVTDVPDQEVVAAAVADGHALEIASILGRRLQTLDAYLSWCRRRLDQLDHPRLLPDVDKAAHRILDAIRSGELVSLAADFDCDGSAASAVLFKSLVAFGHPRERIVFHISHRLTEGYGLNQGLCDRILSSDERPTLVITADNGSSDEPRIAQLKEKQVDVIVSDHHAIPKAGAPTSAFAFVSPLAAGCEYPDPTICGAMVAWLLMCRVRALAIEAGLPVDPEFRMRDLLGYVAIASVGDCVSLAGSNNRAVVLAGLEVIRGSEQPWCYAVRERLGHRRPIDEMLAAFQIAPRLASHGRLDHCMPSVSFLLSATKAEALQWFDYMTEVNDQRKALQADMTDRALALAGEQAGEGRKGLAIFLEDGFSGIHGITASRIVEQYGLPAAMIAPWPADPDQLTMSLRSVDGVNIKCVLDAVDKAHPGMFTSFGGHPAAAGARIMRRTLQQFVASFDREVRRSAPDLMSARVLHTDGPLPALYLTEHGYDTLRSLGPYGRGFSNPRFIVDARIRHSKAIGDGSHLALGMDVHGCVVRAVWFGAIPEQIGAPPPAGSKARFVVEIADNAFNGRRNIELMICGMLSFEDSEAAVA